MVEQFLSRRDLIWCFEYPTSIGFHFSKSSRSLRNYIDKVNKIIFQWQV